MLVCLSANAWAQDTLRLNLDKSLEIALSENPTIKIAGKEIERQEYVRKETIGNLMPNLSATGSYNRSVVKTTMDAGGQKFSFEPDNVVTGSLSLSLPLFAPAVYSTLKLNEEQMRAAVESARASKISLVSEVRKSYYNILLAQQSLEVLRASEANLRQTVDQTQTMYKQGLSSEYDLLTAQVQLSNLQPTIIQTQNSIKVAKQLFKMYLYLPQSVEVELDGTLEQLQDAALNSDRQLGTDLSNNTDVKQLDIQKNILGRQLKLAQTSRMPSLSAVGNFQMMGRDKISLGFGDPTGGTASPEKEFEFQHPLSVGLQLSVPIFAGWSRTNKEKQIKNNIEQLELQRDYLAQSVDVQAKTAMSNILTARAQMEANQVTIAQAQKGYDIAKTRYFSGVGTILEFNTAELSLTQAKLNFSQSVYDYLSAEAEYLKVLGHEN